MAPVICIPGLTRNARDFEGVAERLAGRRRVICVDLRGRGQSAYAKDPMTYMPLTYVQDMEALLREQAIEKFIAIGTSLGGLITMLLASMGPGRVIGALLNDIGPEIEEDGLARIRTYVGQGRSYPTWVHAARDLEENNADVFPDNDVSDWLRMAKRQMEVSPGGRIVLDYDMKIAEPFAVPGGEAGVDLWPALNSFSDIPTVLVHGAKSDILSAATAQKMMDRMNKGELVTLPNIGHAPTLDEPEVQAAIDRLLDRVDG